MGAFTTKKIDPVYSEKNFIAMSLYEYRPLMFRALSNFAGLSDSRRIVQCVGFHLAVNLFAFEWRRQIEIATSRKRISRDKRQTFRSSVHSEQTPEMTPSQVSEC